MGAIASDCVCQSAGVGMIGTVERARGRWREILPLFGIETRYLVNRHGPCPLCGGKDRFRFDDKDGAGTYYCNQCGAGAGLLMIRKLRGWDHKTACDAIDKIIGSMRAKTKPQRERMIQKHAGAQSHAFSTRRVIPMSSAATYDGAGSA